MAREVKHELFLPGVTMITMFVLLMMTTIAHAQIIDLTTHTDTVIRFHNNERTNVRPQAANMRRVLWDPSLQARAEQWASRCQYQRPPHEWRVGSNLYYHRDAVHGYVTPDRIVKASLDAWARQKTYFSYSSSCGSACHYVQMIHSGINRVGCAMSSCERLMTRRRGDEKGTVFICLYSPHVNLRNSFPYEQGTPCSRCRSADDCLGCSQGTLAVNAPDRLTITDKQRYYPERPSRPSRPSRPYVRPSYPERPYRPSRQVLSDSMSTEEEREVLELTNQLRQENGLSPLTWDSYLNRWTDHVINCSVDYPGPSYTYSNFHRYTSNGRMTAALYEWQNRATEKPPRTEHKCRTPNDRAVCSHWSNMMEPEVTAMSCSAKSCQGYSRQMICIYDNRSARDSRLAELRRRDSRPRYNTNSRYTYPRNEDTRRRGVYPYNDRRSSYDNRRRDARRRRRN